MVNWRPYINKTDSIRLGLACADVREASNRGTNGQQPHEFRRLCARQLPLTMCVQSAIRAVYISPTALSVSVHRRFGKEASINSSEADQARSPGPTPVGLGFVVSSMFTQFSWSCSAAAVLHLSGRASNQSTRHAMVSNIHYSAQQVGMIQLVNIAR